MLGTIGYTDGKRNMLRKVIQCRSNITTGEFTYSIALRPGPRVIRFADAGMYWKEQIEIEEGAGAIFIKDVDPTGHYCYCLPERELAEVERECGHLPCGLPAAAHKKRGTTT